MQLTIFDAPFDRSAARWIQLEGPLKYCYVTVIIPDHISGPFNTNIKSQKDILEWLAYVRGIWHMGHTWIEAIEIFNKHQKSNTPIKICIYDTDDTRCFTNVINYEEE